MARILQEPPSTRTPASASRRSRSKLAIGITSGVLVLGLAGYGVADALDVIPSELGLPSLLTTTPAIVVQPVPAPLAAAEQQPVPTSGLEDSAPVPASVKSVIDPVLASSRISGLGIEVRDALTDTVLYAKDADKGRTPASVTKVLTAGAALDAIGPATRFSTDVRFDPRTLTLTLVGGGDVLLGADTSRPDAINGHAGLGTLAVKTAQALAKEGVTTVTLTLDGSRYPGPDFNSGWVRSDIAKGEISPIHPIMVDTGYLAASGWVRPRSAHPDTDALTTFGKRLEAEGVTVTTTSADGAATTPAAGELIASVESATVAEVAEYALVHSDNVVAEVLGREVAIASGHAGSQANAPQAVLDTLARTVDLGATHLEDTSGLTYANRIAPHDLTTLLQASVVAEDGLSGLIGSFPVGGVSGTLSERFTDAKGSTGVVRAKTGSLSTVTSLAGGVRDVDGRYLVFALQVDGLKRGTVLDARKTVDDIVTGLADCGCP